MEKVEATALIEACGGIGYFRDLSSFGALSDEAITYLLREGEIRKLEQGEYLSRIGVAANQFEIVLKGKTAFYRHAQGQDVLTRYFKPGEQMGFDLMIGLIEHNGTDVAQEETLLLGISSKLFYSFHTQYPAEFGVWMINLSRELSREIALLEEVISRGTGWDQEEGAQ